MKGFKRIILWTLIPITFEILGLFFIDKFYLNATTTFNPKKVEINSNKKIKEINVKIPKDASDVTVSYKGDYVSYIEGDTIKVVDTSNNKKKEVALLDGAKLSTYKWLDDKDILLIGEKFVEDSSSYFKFESYDAKKDSKKIISDEKNTELKFTFYDEEYDIKDIAYSSATNVTYLRFSDGDGKNTRILRYNVMANKEEIKLGNINVSQIAATNKEDKLVYEDRKSNRIRITGMKNPIATGENASHYLLDTDKEDMIYVGNGDQDGKVKKVFGINLKKNRDSWKILQLKNPTDKNNIYIAKNGKVYINDAENGVVTNAETGKETKYSGQFVGIYSFGVVSQKDNKVVSELFESES